MQCVIEAIAEFVDIGRHGEGVLGAVIGELGESERYLRARAQTVR
jgi:hypothetical protein